MGGRVAVKRFAYVTVPRVLARSAVLRALAVVPATLGVLVLRRQRCWVSYDNGWVHHYRDGVVVRDVLGGPSPAAMRATTRDVFLWAGAIGAGDAVLDVGAGIGEELFLFSELVGPRGTVIAIEAHPRTYALLAQNCRRNQLANVVTLNVAVGDCDGTARISDGEESTTRAVGATGIEVPATTLATVLREYAVVDVALLKMNIEGAEAGALRGLGAAVRSVRRAAVSCHDFLADAGARGDDARTRSQVEAFWRDAGFRVASRPGRAGEPWIRDYVYATAGTG
jgi:FkbM family methyltransferase